MGAGPIVTLLTDFGSVDSYVAEMKGVMLTIDPSLRFVDINHEVAPGDVAGAQYVLSRTWPRFPPGTVHLVVVDPGVGTSRRALAATAHGHAFTGPDNGVLTPALDEAAVVALDVPEGAAPTFHGRDVFAPAAARLARGDTLRDLGEPVDRWYRLPPPEARLVEGGVTGAVVHVDRFGTLVTNIPVSGSGPARIVSMGERTIGPLRRTFADVEPGVLLALAGSGGTVEIAVRDGSAARALDAGVGAEVRVTR